MNLRLFTAFLAGALFASAALNVMLWSKATAPPPEPKKEMPLQVLRLTPEQMQDLKQRGSSMLELARDIRVELRRTMGEVQTLLGAPDLDPDQLDDLLRHVDELRRQEIELYRDTVLAVRGVLDHDQVAALHQALAGGSAD